MSKGLERRIEHYSHPHKEMKRFQVFRAVSYIYEVEAEDWADAELKVITENLEPVAKIPTDDIYTEELG